MKRRRVILGVGGCVVAGILAVALWPEEKEPEYGGKKLSEWLEICGRYNLEPDAPEGKLAAGAIRAMGTNAVPFLVKLVCYGEPQWRDRLVSTYSDLPAFLRSSVVANWINRSYLRQWRALHGFIVLGPEASAAAPELAKALREGKGTTRRYLILPCLMCIGKGARPAIPAVIEALSSSDEQLRWQATNALVQIAPELLGTNAVSAEGWK